MDPAPSPRSRTTFLAVGGALLGALLLGLYLASLPSDRVLPVIGLLAVGLNLICLGAFLWRAVRSRPERAGWMLLSLGMLLALGANVITRHLSLTAPAPVGGDWAFLGLHLAAGALQMMGVLVWPRDRHSPGSPLLHLLGSLLFATSLIYLLWLGGLWSGEWSVSRASEIRNLGLAGRMALFGGALVYLVGMDARRLESPLGWFLGVLLAVALLLGFLRPFNGVGPVPLHVSPGFGAAFLAPTFFALGALLGGPVVPESQPRPSRFPMGEAAAYVPYLLSGSVLAILVLQRREPLAWPLLAFIAITGLLVLRQFLLMRELKRVNQDLEEQVLARTRDLERMQKVVVRTERLNALGTLGAGLAHDLNNLLSAVRGSAELMDMDLEDGRIPSSQDLNRIQEATARAGDLTQRLMAFARREQGADQRDPMDPSDAVGSLEDLLRMLCGSRVSLQVERVPAVPGILVDPTVIEQVLVNLVGNAKDALNGKGTIQVRVRAGEREQGRSTAVIEVEDDGPGIPAHLRERIFEPFFTTKPEGKGTGLGLASVQVLADSLEGRLELRDTGGRGACFRFTFPGT